MKKEINSHDWADFCRRVTRERQGSLVTIATTMSDGAIRETATDVPFEKMDLDTSNACNDVLQLRVRTEREDAFDIVDPIHIILEESQPGGDFNPIEIDGENGQTFITFRPAIRPEMLSGLKVK